MPADIVRMQTLPNFPTSPAVRVLTKGPDYLRKQLGECTAKARVSAVERLAADRAKYVKSQWAVVSGAKPSSASESSSCSESCSASSAKKSEESTPPPPPTTPQSGGGGRSPSMVRRGSAKKQLRPDSLVMYRQKTKGQTGDGAQGNCVRRLAQGAAKDKMPIACQRNFKEPGEEKKTRATGGGDLPANAELRRPGIKPKMGLQRSLSDLSSRYSKTFGESDAFFRYCGLDPDVIDDLGRENFAAAVEHVALRGRTISVATSEGGFSRRSGDEDGLQEEELSEQLPSCTSVVERNARIIKWLYGCKRARESKKVFQEPA